MIGRQCPLYFDMCAAGMGTSFVITLANIANLNSGIFHQFGVQQTENGFAQYPSLPASVQPDSEQNHYLRKASQEYGGPQL